MFMFTTMTSDDADWQQQIRAQYDEFGPALRRRCERVLRNSTDAMDVVQELFADIWHKQRGDLDFPYLYTAATNRCITLLRTHHRRRTLLGQQPTQEPPQNLLPEESIFSQQCLREFVVQLDKTTAAIFLYRYIDEMTQAEIGEVMGLSRKTVGKKMAVLSRKVEKFSSALQKKHCTEVGETDVR